MEIRFRTSFERDYKKLTPELKNLVEERTKLFIVNPFDSKLKTHKLNGKFADYWGFSIDFKIRVLFRFENSDIAEFYRVGDHDIYD